MKRLFILTILLALTASVVGCKSCRGWWRGMFLDPCPPADACCDPCVPVITQPTGCTSCTATPGTVITAPGPQTYVPAN